MRWANKSVQDLDYNSRAAFEAARFRPPQPGTQSELEIRALGLGTSQCRVKGDVTMTNWSRQERDSLRISASTLSQ